MKWTKQKSDSVRVPGVDEGDNGELSLARWQPPAACGSGESKRARASRMSLHEHIAHNELAARQLPALYHISKKNSHPPHPDFEMSCEAITCMTDHNAFNPRGWE